MRALVWTWLAVCLLAPSVYAAETAPVEHLDGSSVEAFVESRDTLERLMSPEQRLAFHMKLAQVRNKLAEQRARALTDAEFAAALDGKTLEEVRAMADAAPISITIDIEPHDDT